MNSPSRKRIAVIGSGVAGLTAAHLLDSHHDVVLFEKSNRLGGHTNTIVLPDGPDRGISIDTGFIVYNQKNYPLFCRLMNKLGVETAPSDMAFGLTCAETGLEYCSDFPAGLFAQRRNVINPQFFRFINDIFRFNKIAKKDLSSDRVRLQALGDWLKSHKAGRMFLDFYLLRSSSKKFRCSIF